MNSYQTDYSFSSPTDSWPSSLEEDGLKSRTTISRSEFQERRLPRPIRTIRKVAGWVLGIQPIQRVKSVGSHSLL